MMVKWAYDGLLQANASKMLDNDGQMLICDDGEMLVNDGEMIIWSMIIVNFFHHHKRAFPMRSRKNN